MVCGPSFEAHSFERSWGHRSQENTLDEVSRAQPRHLQGNERTKKGRRCPFQIEAIMSPTTVLRLT